VVACLKEAEAAGEGGGGTALTAAGEAYVGVSQHDIIRWHVKEELAKGAIATPEDVAAEYHLLKKVIHVMVAREGVLVEMQVPARREGEGDTDYVARRERERLLIINPNYYLE